MEYAPTAANFFVDLANLPLHKVSFLSCDVFWMFFCPSVTVFIESCTCILSLPMHQLTNFQITVEDTLHASLYMEEHMREILKAVSFTDCQQYIHMWNCDVEKLCVELSHGVQSSLRTTHQLGATFTNMFTEPANDPWTCVHRSGSCLLSTTGPLPLVFAILSLAMAWIPFIIAYCYMVGPYYWRWGHGSSQGGASIVDNNSIYVLSTWSADYIHRHIALSTVVQVVLSL